MSQATEMSSVFEATRQFVVLPDKRYQVELRNCRLYFRRTGSQFDSQWVVRGAKSILGDEVAGRIEQLSPRSTTGRQ